MGAQYKKQFVAVDAHYTSEGKMEPTQIYWTDGRIFMIDEVVDITNAASLKVGGAGVKFRVLISGEEETYERDLWLVEGRWFVEAKSPA